MSYHTVTGYSCLLLVFPLSTCFAFITLIEDCHVLINLDVTDNKLLCWIKILQAYNTLQIRSNKI